MKNPDSESLSFASLALALAGDYRNLFVIDAENDSYIEYSRGAEEQLVQVNHGENFFKDVRRDSLEQVWCDDQQLFLNTFKKDSVVKSLENGQSFSLTYRLNIEGTPRYFFLKTIRANNRNIIIGVQDIDAQKRKELEAEKASRTYSEIAKSLASLFEVIYHIDIETGHYSEYSASESYAKLGFKRSGENFFERARKDVQSVIHPDDCTYVMNQLKRNNLLKRIRSSGSVSITYRQVLDGEIHFMNLLAFRQKDDAEHIVIGVRNIDEQKKQESERKTYSHIAGALASRYEVIYYVDMDSNEYTQYSASDEYSKLGTAKQGADFFLDAFEDIKKYIHPDDMHYIIFQLGKQQLTQNLKKTGSVTLSYRQTLDGRYQYMNMVIVNPKNDPCHIVIGVFNTDALVRHEQSIRAENQTFSDISMALAHKYEIIYHVNVVTNEYVEYTASEQYAKLKSGAKGENFFKDTQENIKHDIYFEDIPMMSVSMQKDNLLNSLSSFGKTLLNYRLLVDGKPQYASLYAVRPQEDSEHIIIAVANVDSAKRMELAYQNAIDMANKDALTGVKNKRAYVQAEVELDEQIETSAGTEFAVVICDVNGLKQVNDNQGHKAGDEFIRKACSIICNTFKHSPVFRIGGDEFAVILKGQDYQNRKVLMNQLHDFLQDNKKDGMELLASGISDFKPSKDIRVQDVFERADSLMYEDKKICKSHSALYFQNTSL